MVLPNQGRADSIEELAQLLLKEVWTRGDLALVDELVTEDYRHADPLLSEAIQGPAGLKQTVSWYRQGVPDLTKTVEDTIVDGPIVVIQYTATGTHQGWILGIEPTGRTFAVEGVYRCEGGDGRLADGIDVWDGVGLLRQLGVLSQPIANRKQP